MTIPSRPVLQNHTRAAWRRAADELLIDAIFGSSTKVVRDDAVDSAATIRPGAPGLVARAIMAPPRNAAI